MDKHEFYSIVEDILITTDARKRREHKRRLLASAYAHGKHKVKTFSKVRRVLDRSKWVSVTSEGYIQATWYDFKKKGFRTTYFAQVKPTPSWAWDDCLKQGALREEIIAYFTIWEAEGLTGFRDLSEYKPFP